MKKGKIVIKMKRNKKNERLFLATSELMELREKVLELEKAKHQLEYKRIVMWDILNEITGKDFTKMQVALDVNEITDKYITIRERTNNG